MASSNNRIPTPWSQRLADFRRQRVPQLAWVAAVITCVLLLGSKGGRFQYIGLADALDYEVSASSAGRLELLLVDVYDDIAAGDVLARLDTTEIDARLERSRATIRQLDAAFDAARLGIRADRSRDSANWSDGLRRFQADEENRRLQALEVRVAVDTGTIEEERWAVDLARTARLFDEGLVAQAAFDSTRLRFEEVARRNESNRVLLARLEQESQTARERRIAFERGSAEPLDAEVTLQPLREAIAIEHRRLEELRAQRGALVLRSPVSGRVSHVWCRQGQSVVPGEPIVTVTEVDVTRIVTFLREADDRLVPQQSLVRLARETQPRRVVESVVLHSGSALEPLPQRLWRSPAVPDYGRAVVIAASPALQLTRGERIRVDFAD